MQQESSAVGDFDRDGAIDAFRGSYDYLKSQWTMSFIWNASSAVPIETDEKMPEKMVFPEGWKPVDVEGDGSEKLIAAANNTLTIVRVPSRHVQVETMPFTTASGTFSLHDATVEDLDGDGTRDLVFNGFGTVGFARGGPSKTFSGPVMYAMGVAGITLVDVDGDGRRDVAATIGGKGLLVLYANRLQRSLNVARLYPLGFAPLAGAAHRCRSRRRCRYRGQRQ
jgi:hypothetical protein